MERVTNKGDIMYLKYIQIVNFKNLKAARFEFAKGANTIIGENDSGKSNALTAIRILLDDNYYYNTKRLKETDFSYALGDWRGHWIIISAFFESLLKMNLSRVFDSYIDHKVHQSRINSRFSLSINLF